MRECNKDMTICHFYFPAGGGGGTWDSETTGVQRMLHHGSASDNGDDGPSVAAYSFLSLGLPMVSVLVLCHGLCINFFVLLSRPYKN